MRIRYGKSIKVKSLLGKQDSLSFNDYYSDPSSYRTVGNGEYIFSNGLGLTLHGSYFTNITLDSTHQYLFIRLDTFQVTQSSEYSCNIDGSLTSHTGAYRPENSHYTLVKFTDTTEFIGWECYRWGGDAWNNTMYPLAFSLIDLTAIGLDTLTAEQFYNKYNRYLPLLATGEEITIDNKTGQIAYENLNDDVIRCKAAGGSSDIYYGYNQYTQLWSDGSYGGVTITATNNGRGILLQNTATSWFTYDNLFNTTILSGHKVLVRSTVVNNTGANFGYRLRYNNGTIAYSGNNFNQIITLSGDINKLQLYADLNDDCTGITLDDCNIIDLTAWFGSGKEPTTIAEFEEKFIKNYYGYCPTSIKLTHYQIEALPNYGYNQVFKIGSSNECNRAYDSEKDEFTLTANSSTTHNYFGLTCYGDNYNLDSIKGHKALCIAKITEISTADAFSNIQFRWSLSNITDRQDIAQPGIVWGIGTWGTANQTFINIIKNSGTFTQGDYFKVTNVQIIDLTDWYGTGNEPTTYEQFKATFPNRYYPYSKKRLLNKYIINKLIN